MNNPNNLHQCEPMTYVLLIAWQAKLRAETVIMNAKAQR